MPGKFFLLIIVTVTTGTRNSMDCSIVGLAVVF